MIAWLHEWKAGKKESRIKKQEDKIPVHDCMDGQSANGKKYHSTG
jgi:hypothetical protein